MRSSPFFAGAIRAAQGARMPHRPFQGLGKIAILAKHGQRALSRSHERGGRIPCQQGKKQGISPIQPFSAKIRHENICDFSSLQNEFPARVNRESIRDNRELFPRFGLEQGIGKTRRSLVS
jgi:hypothetical protein